MVLNFIVAILPIVFLIIALTVLKMPGFKACLASAIITAIVAIAYFKMGALEVVTASFEGILNALWPICLVIVAALFVYNLTLETKAMDKIKAMLSGVSMDKRILALIIGWGFGNFMEGMAGFGTAVAIPASILIAMGFEPATTVIGLLVVNSTPTAFGSVGVPLVTLSGITGIDPVILSGNTAFMQAIITFVSPFVLIALIGKGTGKGHALKGMWGMTILAALSFIVPEFIAARFIGPELGDIIGAIVCMIVMVLVSLKMNTEVPEEFKVKEVKKVDLDLKSAIVAWCPFILIFVILLLTSSLVPAIHDPLSSLSSKVSVYSGDNPGSLNFAWINTPGILIMIAGLIGGLVQGASVKTIVRIYFKTLVSNWKTIVTICSVLALAKIMGYSGMISAIAALLVTVTGKFYPLFTPLIGTLGGFVTGSGTSTQVLFGQLQVETAKAINADPSWLASANAVGAGLGKMISPQGIAIGCAAAGLAGQESIILKRTFKYALIFAIIAGIICFTFPLIGIV
ncbi:MAG: L-lactate permease [Lachnospiraceae bacterium]|nr:L-lactate permease [Lachnospiraceae bacterium]